MLQPAIIKPVALPLKTALLSADDIALAAEFLLGTAIWIRKFRYPLLVFGVLFHLSLEWAINVPMFQWDVLSSYVLFIDPADLDRALRRLTSRAPNAPATIASTQ